MVKSTGAQYVILGHSERRGYYGETPEILKEKVLLALKNGLKVIFCIGESLEEREANKQNEVVKAELEGSVFNPLPRSSRTSSLPTNPSGPSVQARPLLLTRLKKSMPISAASWLRNTDRTWPTLPAFSTAAAARPATLPNCLPNPTSTADSLAALH